MKNFAALPCVMVLLAAIAVGALDGPPVLAGENSGRQVTENREQMVVFTGDLIRLTHHDQSVTEGFLVSMGRISLTLSDTTDTDDETKIFFTSIEKLEVSRGDSMICLQAYAVDSSWMSFKDITPPDSMATPRRYQ